ncbi:MAG: YfhO family protein [Acidobacteriota bacterium]|nr:YfhO family protein [Acidobacteriota bacterium]
MPAIFLYLPVAIGLIALWHRFIQPIRLAAAIVLVLLPFCFTGRALLTGRVYGPIDLPYMSEPLLDYAEEHGIGKRPTGQAKIHNGTISDLYMQMIPWQAAVRASLGRGEWPMWNPYMLCGTVLAANMQSAPYDPLQFIALILPQPQAITFGAAMTFFLAGLFTFAFARTLGLGETASLIGAAAYMFSAMLAYFVGWPLGRTWTFLPLLLVGVRLVVRETSLRAAVVLTSAFVMALVVGHPESVLHIVVVGVAYGAFEVATTRRFKSIALAALCGVLAVLLTAVALLPFLEAAPQTMEFFIRHEFYKKQPLPFGEKEVLRRAGISTLAWYGGQPEHDNHTPDWEPTNIRTGALVVALALAALVLAPRRRETWFFFGTAVICGWIGLNAWPLADWLHRVPLFDITINERLALAAAFALSMLAAFAADAWPSQSAAGSRQSAVDEAGVTVATADRRPPTADSIRAFAAAAIVTGVAIVIVMLSARVFDSRIALGVKPGLITVLTVAALLPLAMAALMLALRTPARIALPLLLGMLLLQRTLEDGQIYPVLPQRVFYPPTPILTHMQSDKSEPFRMGAMHYMFLPDAAALYGLEDVRGYEAMTFLPLAETYGLWSVHSAASFNGLPDKSRPMLSLLNMKYLIALPAEPADDQWKVVKEDRNARLLENSRVLPRAFLPRRIRYEQHKDHVIYGMSKSTDFSDMAWILAPELPPHEISNGRGTLTTRRNGRTFEIKATMLEDGWVVLSESAWKGWRAYVDGKRVQTQFANHAFLGVYVPKGTHEVRVVYQPESFTRGRNITLVTIVGLIAFFVWRRWRQRS